MSLIDKQTTTILPFSSIIVPDNVTYNRNNLVKRDGQHPSHSDSICAMQIRPKGYSISSLSEKYRILEYNFSGRVTPASER